MSRLGAYAPVLGVLASACLSHVATAAEPRRMPPTLMLIDEDTLQFDNERIAVRALGAWNRLHRGALCPDKTAGLMGGALPVSDQAVERARRALVEAGCERVALLTQNTAR